MITGTLGMNLKVPVLLCIKDVGFSERIYMAMNKKPA